MHKKNHEDCLSKKTNNTILVLTTMFFFFIIFAQSTHAFISIEKYDYNLGEQVIFIIESEEGETLEITHPERVFRLIGDVKGEHKFFPELVGKYTISVIDSDMNVIESISFFVNGDTVSHDSQVVVTDKKEYKTGDRVIISLLEQIDVESVSIVRGDVEYSFMGAPNFPLSFFPDNIGTYNVKIRATNNDVYKTSFETKPITSILDHPVFGSSSKKPARVVNNKGEIRNIKINFFNDSNTIQNNALQIAELEINEKYDAEINIGKNNLEKVNIKGLKYKEDLRVGVDTIRNVRVNEKNSKILSLDLDFEFSDVEIKRIAEGTELFVCEAWNFEAQECLGSWEKIRDLVPGDEYEIRISHSAMNAYAETGVASINTKKSIYKPGDVAEIVIVVLDKDGYLVPGATINVNVTSPDNETTTYKTINDEIVGGEKGVYYLNHTTTVEGRYDLSVSASARNVNDSMMSYFNVLEFYEFDIIRDTPVTIDPFLGPFKSSISIIPLINVTSYSFTEVLPASFTVHDRGGAIEMREDDLIYLTWTNLNNSSKVSYSFNSPFIIPYLWEIGPSVVEYETQELESTQIFTEARPWYLAIDPITYYDPTSDITTGWSSGTGTSYTQISKTTRQPSAPNTGTYIASQMNAGETSEFGFSSITESGVESITLWVYTQTGGNAQYTFSLRRAGVDLCNTTVPSGASIGWRSCSWTPTDDLSSLSVHFSTVTRSGGGGPTTALAYSAYLEVDTGNPPPVVTLNAPTNNSIQTSTPVTFSFTATDETYSTLTCRLYTNTTGSWDLTTTLNNVNTNTLTSTTLSPSDDVYIWNVECENADSKSAFAENNRTVIVNANAPLIENEAINETLIRQNRTVRFNATITDSFGIDTARITVTYPNSSTLTHNLQRTGNEFYFLFEDTIDTGIYNITNIWANDTLGQSSSKNSNLWFEVEAIPPTAFDLISPINATESRNLTPTFSWEATTTPDFDNYTLLLDKDSSFSSPDFIYSTASIISTSYLVDFALDINSAYYWKVIAYDVFGNSRESTSTFVYINDRINPTVTLESPQNNFFTANNEVQFSYTPSDANTIDYCELLTNETGAMTVQETNSSIVNGGLNYFTRTLPEGLIRWNVRCFDDATNSGIGSERLVTVDTTGPSVTLISPVNDTLIDDTNIVTFTATTFDALTSVDYCELLINGTVAEVENNIIDNVNFNFTTFLVNNYYEWNVRCYDELGNNDTSSSRFLTVESLDTDPPVITLIDPINNAYLDSSTVFFEYLVEDATGIDSCSILIDGSVDAQNTSIINFENNNFTITSFNEDNYNWSITCTDNSSESNVGFSNTRYFTVDLTNPVVTLNSPNNDSFLNFDNVNFVYTPQDDNLDYCSLYTNFTGTFSETSTNNNPTNNVQNTFNINAPSGVFVWNVRCYDLSSRNSFASNNFTISIDTEAPKYSNIAISPTSPTSYVNNEIYWFNITWTDNFEVDTVIFEHNFSGIVQEEILTSATDFYNFSIQNLNAGIYSYKWRVNDSSSNNNETNTFTYTVNKAEPVLNLYLNSVQDNLTIDEDNSVSIQGEIITPSTGFIELFLDGDLINSSVSNVNNNILFSEPGLYNVTLLFNETLNFLESKKTFFITVNDITSPMITLISPANDSLLATGSRNLIYRVNDSSSISSCSLYINNVFNQTSSSVTKNVDQSFSITTIEDTYSWRVECVDEFSNTGISETRTFTAVSDDTINVFISTQAEVEQGSPAIISINTTDAFGNTLQTSIANYIITGNTTAPWWNTSWNLRQNLEIEEDTGTAQTNSLIGINITGLGGNIASCQNELRLIRHVGAQMSEIPYRIYYTDNSTWCFVGFYANLSASELNTEYYVYYNNSAATNPNYDVDVLTSTLFNAQESAADDGTPTNVADIIGKNDATFATMTQGGGTGTHSAHGRAFITQTAGPIEKVEISYRYEVPASSGTWSLRYSVNDGTDYSAIASGTTTVAKSTSSWFDITNIYPALTWTNLNSTRLQGHVTKTGGGSITLYLFWVEMNVTHYRTPDVFATNNVEEELVNTQIDTTDTSGLLELSWSTKDFDLGFYTSSSIASSSSYNDATNFYSFEVVPDVTPPNVSLISPEDWFESGKGLFDFTYFVFDYNLDYCTLFIGNFSESLSPVETSNSPTNNASNTFEDVFVDIGVYEWNVRCHDVENNSAFATSNYVLNISAPDLVVRDGDIWFNYTQLIEGVQVEVFANISNEGLSPAEDEFAVHFYLNDPALGGDLIATRTISELASLGVVTLSVNHTLIAGSNNIFVLVDPFNVINETTLDNNKANSTLDVELYQYYFGSSKSDIVLGGAEKSLFIQYPNLSGLRGHVFFADADSDFSFESLQALTRNIDGNLVAGDFAALDGAMNTSDLKDSIKNIWGGGTEVPVMTKTFNLSSGQVLSVPIVYSTEYPEFVTGILWDTSDDSGNLRYDGVDRESVVFVTEINPGNTGRFGEYDFEIRVPATLRDYDGSTNKIAFYVEII